MPDRPPLLASLTGVPVDLVIIGLLGLWAVSSSAGQISGSPAQMTLGFVAILFAPGYAFVAALFPRDGGLRSAEDPLIPVGRRITTVERLLLSLGLSVSLVPLIALGLNYTPVGVRPSVIVGTVGTVTLMLTAIAAISRQLTSPDERFHPRILGFVLGVGRAPHVVRDGPKLNHLVVVGLIVAGMGVGFAALEPDRGERFTEFYLLTEDRESGELVAEGYPDEMARGESERLFFGVQNRESRTTTYTVVVLLEEVGDGGEILERQTIHTDSVTVSAGETVEQPHRIQPEMTGTDLKMTYLLYRGSPPEEATLGPENAYRHVHFWLDVEATQSNNRRTATVDSSDGSTPSTLESTTYPRPFVA